MLNRLSVAKNPYQGDFKKVLCLCSAGCLRSPTMAWVLSNPPFNFNTRAAGVSQEYSIIPLDACLVHWADMIACADQEHADALARSFPDHGKPVRVLHIPDDYPFRDKDLVDIITKKSLEAF